LKKICIDWRPTLILKKRNAEERPEKVAVLALTKSTAALGRWLKGRSLEA